MKILTTIISFFSLILILPLELAYCQIIVRPAHVHPGGEIRDLQHVNNGPFGWKGVFDLAEDYAEMKISSIRTHDYFWFADINHLYKDSLDGNMDPNDPASYDFTFTDSMLSIVHNFGAEIYFRLGYSCCTPPEITPALYNKWATICKHIIMHYNDGWANGLHWNIPYWEIWNEPDNAKGQFWTDTPENFFNLFVTVFDTLKQYNPTLKIGGPGLAGNTEFGLNLLQYCQTHNVIPDFISWHLYGSSSYNPPFHVYLTARRAKNFRQVLDSLGFTETENHLTEWNFTTEDSLKPQRRGIMGGAYLAAVHCYLQDTDLVRAHFYRGDNHSFGLFLPNTDQPTFQFFAMKFAGQMLNTPIRLEITGIDTLGNAAIAGRNAADDTIRIFWAQFTAPPDTMTTPSMQILSDEAPFAGDYSVDASLVTASGQQDTSFTAAGPLNLYQGRQRPAYAFGLVTLAKSTAMGMSNDKQLPKSFQLYPNYPNPFNPTTNVEFGLPNAGWVTLKIYDIAGKEVKTLLKERKAAGAYTIQWDGANNSGKPVASGVYIYRLTAGKIAQSRKMLLLR